MTIPQEAALVVGNLKGDWAKIANYIVHRCGDFVFDHEREALIRHFLVAAAVSASDEDSAEAGSSNVHHEE